MTVLSSTQSVCLNCQAREQMAIAEERRLEMAAGQKNGNTQPINIPKARDRG